MLWISECVFIRTHHSLYNMVIAPFLKWLSIKRLSLHEQAGSCHVRMPQLNILDWDHCWYFCGCRSRQECVKMEEEGLLCICQTIAKSSFFSNFIQVCPYCLRLWFRVGVEVCFWGMISILIGGIQTSCFSAVCVCWVITGQITAFLLRCAAFTPAVKVLSE